MRPLFIRWGMAFGGMYSSIAVMKVCTLLFCFQPSAKHGKNNSYVVFIFEPCMSIYIYICIYVLIKSHHSQRGFCSIDVTNVQSSKTDDANIRRVGKQTFVDFF